MNFLMQAPILGRPNVGLSNPFYLPNFGLYMPKRKYVGGSQRQFKRRRSAPRRRSATKTNSGYNVTGRRNIGYGRRRSTYRLSRRLARIKHQPIFTSNQTSLDSTTSNNVIFTHPIEIRNATAQKWQQNINWEMYLLNNEGATSAEHSKVEVFLFKTKKTMSSPTIGITNHISADSSFSVLTDPEIRSNATLKKQWTFLLAPGQSKGVKGHVYVPLRKQQDWRDAGGGTPWYPVDTYMLVVRVNGVRQPTGGFKSNIYGYIMAKQITYVLDD